MFTINNKTKYILIFVLFFHSLKGFSNPDFPNYFLDLVDKDASSSKGENTSHAEEKIEHALHSILKRIRIPYVDDSGKVVTENFFSTMEKKTHQIDPGSKVYVSGGVVRSLLGYLYEKIHKKKEKDPTRKTEEILDSIIQDQKPIDPVGVLGVGSDLDILVSPFDTTKMNTIKNSISNFIESAEKSIQIKGIDLALKNSILPKADVNNYDFQIERTIKQGGSTLDWFAFPIGGQGKFKVPQKHPELLKQFILGHYSYLPAEDSKDSFSDVRIARGLRGYLEIPFLHLDEIGRKTLRELMGKLVDENSGVDNRLSEKAFEQFRKMERNARFGGAKNRIYLHNQEDSEEEKEIKVLLLKLSDIVTKRQPQTINGFKVKPAPLVSKFIPNRDPKKRGNEDRCELSKLGLLTNKASFITKYTDNGRIYHGTPHVDNILSMIRNGPILSDVSQGFAVHGRGFYTTPDRDLATKYGRSNVILFNLKEDIQARVIDLDTVKDNPEFEKLDKAAKEHNISVFEYLAEYCDVDIIGTIPEEKQRIVLIQNAGVLKFPKNVKDLIEIDSNRVLSLPKPQSVDDIKAYLNAIIEHDSLHSLGETIGIQDLKRPLTLSSEILRLLNESPEIQKHTVAALSSSSSIQLNVNNDLAVLNRLVELIDSRDNDVKKNVLQVLSFSPNPKIREKILEISEKKNSDEINDLFINIYWFQSWENEKITQRMLSIASDERTNPSIRERALDRIERKFSNNLPPQLKEQLLEIANRESNLDLVNKICTILYKNKSDAASLYPLLAKLRKNPKYSKSAITMMLSLRSSNVGFQREVGNILNTECAWSGEAIVTLLQSNVTHDVLLEIAQQYNKLKSNCSIEKLFQGVENLEPHVISELVKGLEHHSTLSRFELLKKLDPSSFDLEAMKTLGDLSIDSDEKTSESAVVLLTMIQSKDPEYITILKKAGNSPHQDSAMIALSTLVNLRPNDKNLGKQLVNFAYQVIRNAKSYDKRFESNSLRSNDRIERILSYEKLMKISNFLGQLDSDSSVIISWINILKKGDYSNPVLKTLKGKPLTRQILQALFDGLNDPETSVRRSFYKVIDRLGLSKKAIESNKNFRQYFDLNCNMSIYQVISIQEIEELLKLLEATP